MLLERRWIQIPSGSQIDTSDMDHWVFPIGTKLWKEFSLGGVLLETRLIERYGDGPEDYWMGAFVWNAEQTAAVWSQELRLHVQETRSGRIIWKTRDARHRPPEAPSQVPNRT